MRRIAQAPPDHPTGGAGHYISRRERVILGRVPLCRDQRVSCEQRAFGRTRTQLRDERSHGRARGVLDIEHARELFERAARKRPEGIERHPQAEVIGLNLGGQFQSEADRPRWILCRHRLALRCALC